MTNSNDTPMLLDTNIFSLLLKRGDSRAALYLPDIQGKLLALSFVTIGETYRWAYLHDWGTRRVQELEKAFQKFVVLTAHKEVARHWARIMSIHGQSFRDNDAWIAACALVYGCVLVTHDRHFFDIPGLSIVSHLS